MKFRELPRRIGHPRTHYIDFNVANKMFINDRPVNLEAFGPIDTQHPRIGPMRAWNVVITASEPGEITVRSEGTMGGDPFEGTTTYIFKTP